MTTTSTDWLETAKELKPIIDEYREQGDAERRLPTPVVDAIREKGFLRLWLPRALGGEESDIRTAFQVIEEVARYDGSAAWNLSIGVQSGAILAFLPESATSRILADSRDCFLAGSTSPTGRAIPVEGGYRITGRWPLASGCHQASWLVANCIVLESGAPRMTPAGTPAFTMMFFPAEQAQIHDTWNSTGLRGTGSHDISVDDIFVPEDMAFELFTPRSPYHAGPLYRTILLNVLRSPFAVVSLGIAADAIDTFCDLAVAKTPTMGQKPLAERDHVQMSIGRALAKLNSARSYLYEVGAYELQRALESGAGADETLTTEIGLAATNAAHSAAEAVDLMHSAGGATSIYHASRLERCFRDVHMITQHLALAPSNFVSAGAFRLGFGFSLGR